MRVVEDDQPDDAAASQRDTAPPHDHSLAAHEINHVEPGVPPKVVALHRPVGVCVCMCVLCAFNEGDPYVPACCDRDRVCSVLFTREIHMQPGSGSHICTGMRVGTLCVCSPPLLLNPLRSQGCPSRPMQGYGPIFVAKSPSPRNVLERPYTVGGGGVPPPWRPPLPFQCLRLKAKILLRCLRQQDDFSVKGFGPPSAGTIGRPSEEGGPSQTPLRPF